MLFRAEEDGEGRIKMFCKAPLGVSNHSPLESGKEAFWDTRRRRFRDRTLKDIVCLKFLGVWVS